ncbi:hypothetical protein GCM10012320_02320 [Sinomonas cellulolyticus]|nr:hypothetical protein GCM10012320_02320 [Sinomonas sp. KCTC 49339]
MPADGGGGDVEHLPELGGAHRAVLEDCAEDTVARAVLGVGPRFSLGHLRRGHLHRIHKTIMP